MMVDPSGVFILVQLRAGRVALVEVAEVRAKVNRRGHRLIQVVQETLV